MRRSSTSIAIGAGIAAGVAGWATRGSVDVFTGAGGVARRVAMLPSWPELAGLVVLAVGACLAIAVGLQRAQRSRQRPEGGQPEEARDVPSSDVLLPLFGLTVLALPYVPWLPDFVPVSLVLAGPVRFLVWFVVLAQVAWAAAGRLGLAVMVGRTRTDREIHRVIRAWVPPALILLASLAIFGGAAARLTRSSMFPGGDEPHYLIVAQSLWRDGDFKIENNHARGDYRAYYVHGDLAPHYLGRGRDGEIYSIHPVGLPILMAPVYAVGGYVAVVAALVAIAATAAMMLWVMARRIAGSGGAATFGWIAVAVSAPFLLNSFTVYPEIPAALCVVGSFATGLHRPMTFGRSLIAGLAIAALPWLSTKYAPMAAALAAVVWGRLIVAAADSGRPAGASSAGLGGWGARIVELRAAMRPVLPGSIALLAPLGASVSAWLLFFYWVWGSPSPAAPYAGYAQTGPLNLRVGAPGLLFDQEYGIVVYAPVLLVGLIGLVSMWRSGGTVRWRAVEIVLVFGSLLATVGAFRIWWGGDASPGRPVVSGLLLLGVPAAWQYARAAASLHRAQYVLLLFVSLALSFTLIAAQNGLLIANGRNGTSSLLDWLAPTGLLWRIAPSFIRHEPILAGTFALLWLATGFGAFRIAARAWQRGPSHRAARGRASLVTFAATAFTVTVVSVAVPALFGERLQAAASPEARSRVRLWDEFDSIARPIAIGYKPLRLLTPSDVASSITLTAAPGSRTAPQPVRLLFNARFSLPAGRYRVELLTSRATGTASDERGDQIHAESGAETLALQVGRIGESFRSWPVSLQAGRWEGQFELPIDANLVGFRASTGLERVVSTLRLQPVRLLDAGRRLPWREVLGASTYGSTSVFIHDERTWAEPDGLWVRGQSTVPLTLASHEETPVTLRLHSGPIENTVRLESAGWREQVSLAPGVLKDVSLPVSPRGVVSLKVTTADGFRPSQTDAGSRDHRLLGCWIEILDPSDASNQPTSPPTPGV